MHEHGLGGIETKAVKNRRTPGFRRPRVEYCGLLEDSAINNYETASREAS